MSTKPGHDSIFQDGTPRTSSRTSRLIKNLVWLITPAILTNGPRKPLHSTAYLDGLRGFAAFLVYWQHHQVWARVAISAGHIFENGFGYDGQYYFACIPFIRIFFTGGHVAVTTFFVISGYVLSMKPLKCIHAKEYTKLEESVASALFRRWLRLYIPAIGTTFAYFTIWHLFGVWTAYPKHKDTYLGEVYNWYLQFKKMSWVFQNEKPGESWFEYNFHLWSIPTEFRGSMVIYTIQIAISRCTRNARLAVQIALMFYFMFLVDGWYCSMFIGGMFICDLEMLARENNLPGFFAIFKNHTKRIYQFLFIFAIYLSGVPSYNPFDMSIIQSTPGWYYLSLLRSRILNDYKWFYLFWSSMFIVSAVPHLPLFRKFLESRFCQYLGKISFAFYLVHGPILWTLADRMYAVVGWLREDRNEGLKPYENLFPISKKGPLGMEIAFWVPHLVILPFTFWVAEIATKLFDEPSVKISHWFYRKNCGLAAKS
jgi:peptidoglycan/LPS O-acetylase OafA/YrhL